MMFVGTFGFIGFIVDLSALCLLIKSMVEFLVTFISGIIGGVISAGIFASIVNVKTYERRLYEVSGRLSELADDICLAASSAENEDWTGFTCSMNDIKRLSRELFDRIEHGSWCTLAAIRIINRYRRKKSKSVHRIMDDRFCRFVRTLLYDVNGKCIASMHTEGNSPDDEIQNIFKQFNANFNIHGTRKQICNVSTQEILRDIGILFLSDDERSSFTTADYQGYIRSIDKNHFRISVNLPNGGTSYVQSSETMKDRIFTKDECLKYLPTIAKKDAREN